MGDHPRKCAIIASVGTPELTPLSLHNASFGYSGVAAVTGVTAELYPGEAVALIGPNGSGKSTLLKGLVGLTELLSGKVKVLGKTPQDARQHVGVLPQADQRNTALPINTRQVVAMGLYREHGSFRPLGKTGKARVMEALDVVGLSNRAHVRFGDLSGGQQQRAILARALVSRPKLLLLDEPFNGLDRPNRERMLRTVSNLRDGGTAVVVSTHDLEIAREVCSHAMLLDRRMVTFGPLDDALTLENIAEAFHDTTVEIDSHSVTTRSEVEPGPNPGHLHHEHPEGEYPVPSQQQGAP